MSKFAIMRTAKLKTTGAVVSSVKHALRTRETPNADPTKIKNNTCNLVGENKENQAIQEYKKRLPDKIRKNGVRAIELMMTASPELFQNANLGELSETQAWEAYLKNCDDWAKKTFNEKNIFLISHHFDETTPHSSIMLVPIDERGKLNASRWLDGREKLSKLQDSFAEYLQKNFYKSIERGIKGSKAKHQSIQQYYSRLKTAEKNLKKEDRLTFPEKETFESSKNYQERLKKEIRNKHIDKNSFYELAKKTTFENENLKKSLKQKSEAEDDFKKSLDKEKLMQIYIDLEQYNANNFTELKAKKIKYRAQQKKLERSKNKTRDFER